MRKIPIGAEAANILVGEVDFLSYPMVALVRLLHSYVMPDLTEVPVPTKFVFIMLGPMGNQSKYHEIGRAIATLLSDEVNKLLVYPCMNLHVCFSGTMHHVLKLFNCFTLYFQYKFSVKHFFFKLK